MIKNLYFTFFSKNYGSTEFIFNIIVMIIFIYNINEINIETCSVTMSLLNKKNILSQIIKYPHIIKRFSQGGGKKAGQEIAKKVIPTTPPPIPPAQNNYKSPQQVAKTNNNNYGEKTTKNQSNKVTDIPKASTSSKKELKNFFPPKVETKKDFKNFLDKVFKINTIVEGKSRNEIEELFSNTNNSENREKVLKEWREKVETEMLIKAVANSGILNSIKEQTSNSTINDPSFSTPSPSTNVEIAVDYPTEDNLTNYLSEELIKLTSKIEGFTEILQEKPNQLSKFSAEIKIVHEALANILEKFCNQEKELLTNYINYANIQEYKKIYTDNLNTLDEKQLYTYNAIFGSYVENLSTKEQLEKNIKTLQNIKNSIVTDNLLSPKQLIEIAKKLSLVEYRDVSFCGKKGDEYELVEHKQKQAGQLVLNTSSTNNVIINENLPDLKVEDVIKMLTNKNFYAVDINIKNPKFQELIIPSGVTGHTCIAINYKGKKIILGYLTSKTASPKIADAQLFEEKKTQHFYILKNLCIVENDDVILNEQITEYLKNMKINKEFINVFSCLLPETINKPVIDVPIITFYDMKCIVAEKVDQQLLNFQNKLRKYEDFTQNLKDKDEKKKLQFIVDHLKFRLNEDATRVLNWYIEMEAKKKILAKQEKYSAQHISKEKNNLENNND